MTILWVCRNCTYQARTAAEAFQHRGVCATNTFIEPIRLPDQTGIEKEESAKVLTMVRK